MVQKHSNSVGWTHFEAILRVGQASSVRQAAAALGIAHTTLAKRVAAAERAFGAVAFVRSPQGYVLTDAGREIMAYAERMEREAAGALRAIRGHDRRPMGKVTLSVMAPVLSHVLAPALPLFVQRYPDIDLDIEASYGLTDLRRQKADIAIRFQDEPDDFLVGRRIVKQHDAAYIASRISVDHLNENRPLPVIGWGDRGSVEARARAHGLEAIEIICTTADIDAQKALVRSGLGIGILPCFMCDGDASLTRWGRAPPLPINEAWVLTHPDLAASARVKAVADFCVSTLKAARRRFTGDAPARA